MIDVLYLITDDDSFRISIFDMLMADMAAIFYDYLIVPQRGLIMEQTRVYISRVFAIYFYMAKYMRSRGGRPVCFDTLSEHLPFL